MNELIRELAEQAGYNPVWSTKADKEEHFDLEKFAKLIFLECAMIAQLHDSDCGVDYNSGRTWAGIDILKHFGVEE
jgi:hypothetical protein